MSGKGGWFGGGSVEYVISDSGGGSGALHRYIDAAGRGGVFEGEADWRRVRKISKLR